MDKNKNIWREKFQKGSLETEAWLDPKDDIYASFKSKIEPKKRKKKWMALFFIGLVGLGCIYLYVGTFNNESKAVISKAENFNSKTNLASSKVNDQTLINPESESIINKENSLADNTTSDENSFKTLIKPFKDIRKSTSERTNYSSSNSHTIKANKPQILVSKKVNEYMDIQNEKYINKGWTKKKVSNIKSQLKGLDNSQFIFIPRSTEILFNAITPLPIDQMIINPRLTKVNSEITNDNVYFAYVSGGFSYWKFSLNDHFKDALDPADFYHYEGYGFNAGLGFRKQLINKRYSLGISLNYENISFISGHNSSLEYNYVEEENMSNKVNLVMASPIGFVESSLVLNRSIETNINQLSVSLQTLHEIQTVGLSGEFLAQLIQTKKFGLGVSTNVQGNYITKLSNSFIKAEVIEQGFYTSDKLIDVPQANVKRLIPMAGIGIMTNYIFNPRLSVALEGSYTRSLRSIYLESDFETSLSQAQFSLSLSRKFN